MYMLCVSTSRQGSQNANQLGRRGEMAHLRFVDLLQEEGILTIMFTLVLSKTGDLDSLEFLMWVWS